ncbi:MAG: hypothetical protein O3C57_02220 [Verrucomicrobia bacterium]|nr:hypothetical protein [Verrucomicrobiota bacterium]
MLGVDKKPYGPLPREWAQYKGLYKYGDISILSYTVGDADVLEMMTSARPDVYARILNISKHSKALVHRVASSREVRVAIAGTGATLREEEGVTYLDVPAGGPIKIEIFLSPLEQGVVDDVAAKTKAIVDLSAYTRPGPPIWNDIVETTVTLGLGASGYAVDEIAVPYQNPWESWMRAGGFDFFENADAGAMCTVMGDVWTFSGLQSGTLKWKRMATGLFQPLGLKIVDEKIYVTCRDQIAIIHDNNHDGEADFIEAFNSDHQVTEHFHEFAMGLQTDKHGNFYYAKSARHALLALVPQHGTLIRVGKDGKTSEIIASGFRAANGVCVNDDGTFFVTDQEGHWMPKNRINWVQPDAKAPRFYGNMMGFHKARSDKDEDMEDPLVWLTNEFDRSPAELLWVTSDRWGPLQGSLLSTSYGYGRLYVIPHEKIDGQIQGGASKLEIPDLPTGVMRARFNKNDGQLYICGLSVWATSRNDRPGGFWRIRYTGAEVMQPVTLNVTTQGIKITFSAPLLADGISAIDFEIKVWGLTRSENYGSPHVDEHLLDITDITTGKDGNSIFLAIDGLHATRGMSIKGKVTSAAGQQHPVLIHNTIYHLH